MAWLFGMMNRPWLVSIGNRLTRLALWLRLPVQGIIRRTIFRQFCGGTSLEDSQNSIAAMAKYGVKTVLDYGVEAKDTEADFDATVAENIRAIHWAAKQTGNVPIISTKVSGLARFALLEKVDAGKPLTQSETAEWQRVLERLDKICIEAADNSIGLFIDAEESWVQDAIDALAEQMMERYNKRQAIIYNTFQMYRHDRLEYLRRSFALAEEKGFLLGAKLVRGAYMEKERERAQRLGYDSPIQANKAATDKDYDEAVQFCAERYEKIALCLASHNAQSNLLLTQFMQTHNIAPEHPHLSFCQLYGMSDNITYNLSAAGYQASKYVPYGEVREVIPYLLRRAQENSSVSGEVSRELGLIRKEQTRRKTKTK